MSSEEEEDDNIFDNVSNVKQKKSNENEPIMDSNTTIDSHQLESHKKKLYGHPLFPLLALLLEKCEQATEILTLSGDCNLTGNSFNSEIQAFIHHQQKQGKTVLGEDPEVDTLMIKAIQVLRIHLLELEKVQELCKDFCQRYINCLRTKMSSENLLRGTPGTTCNASYDGSSCSSASSDECSSFGPSNFATNSSNNNTNNTVTLQTDSHDNSQKRIEYQNNIAQNLSKVFPVEESESPVKPCSSVTKVNPSINPKIDSGNEGDLSDDASNISNKKHQKRGVLPKQATSVMRSWLFQHIVHPYPTEDEKKAIAAQTNLTLLQVNNWFINARRRILQPMLDSASVNGDNNGQNAKKLKTCNKNASVQRFWPESIANAIKIANKGK